MKEFNYTVIYEPVRDGGYTVIVPAIPEIFTFGETRIEALEMARDAIRCFLESSLQAGDKIPDDVDTATEHLAVTVS